MRLRLAAVTALAGGIVALGGATATAHHTPTPSPTVTTTKPCPPTVTTHPPTTKPVTPTPPSSTAPTSPTTAKSTTSPPATTQASSSAPPSPSPSLTSPSLSSAIGTATDTTAPLPKHDDNNMLANTGAAGVPTLILAGIAALLGGIAVMRAARRRKNRRAH